MPQDLYDQDALAWSQQQAELLRRTACGERVNGLDWEHVVEEIEDVGLSELHRPCTLDGLLREDWTVLQRQLEESSGSTLN